MFTVMYLNMYNRLHVVFIFSINSLLILLCLVDFLTDFLRLVLDIQIAVCHLHTRKTLKLSQVLSSELRDQSLHADKSPSVTMVRSENESVTWSS